MHNKRNIIKHIISIAMITLVIIAIVLIYKKYNYNDFIKTVQEKNKTSFTRDSQITYSDMDSYLIENKDYNDAMFYEIVNVKPNTAYKVSCKVKTENVENDNNTKSGGANISIMDTTERSYTISGTNDWQELTFLFNSKNREKVKLGFRLGGYEEKSKGKAWFSDFTIEEGIISKSNKWKVGCFIFPNIDVNVQVNGKTENVKLKMSQSDIDDLKINIDRFKTSIQRMSNNKMQVDYDLYTIEKPLKTLSYDNENEYYVSPEDVYEYINSYVEKNEYDHIYVGIRMADIQSR